MYIYTHTHPHECGLSVIHKSCKEQKINPFVTTSGIS